MTPLSVAAHGLCVMEFVASHMTRLRRPRLRAGALVEWLINELVILAGPAYFFLQLFMAARYRGRWLVLALVPLILMVPLAIHAGSALAAGSSLWPLHLILAAPLACVYLLGLAVVKANVT
jgi:hypothetical protein